MESDRAQESFICAVCGEPVEAAASAECNWCDRRYHLNQRNDVEGRDCGQVWIDEQYMALQFACDKCLAGNAGGARPAIENPAIAQIPQRQEAVRPASRRHYKRRA